MFDMRFYLIGMILIMVAQVFSQTWARASYSTNGKMVEIADLQGLQSCSVTNESGKVKKIKVSDLAAMVTIKGKEGRIVFQVPLVKVNPDDRKALFGHLVSKGNTLEIAGYRCSGSAAPSAISIRRVY